MTRCSKIVSFVISLSIVGGGCLDRKPTPVCPVPIEVGSNEVNVSQFDGVDILAVVDNSGSMAQEQQVLAAGFFTLINSLVNPPSDWPHPAVSDVRVAVVSSDLGLQYGDARDVTHSPLPSPDPRCDLNESRGADGRFLPITAQGNVITVLGDQIPCETDGNQCPPGYSCEQGRCSSLDGTNLMMCPSLADPYAATTGAMANTDFTAQVACLAIQGTEGCAFEQQLEATVRSLERDENKSFVKDSHLLAVLTVSDEEDCSMKDEGLFSTEEWVGRKLINTACNRTPENEGHLFETDRYREKLLAVKDYQENAVIFAAIVGVPDGDNICQGTGTDLRQNGCLAHPSMQLILGEMDDGTIHFVPACKRFDNQNVSLTDARPGRRFVEVAESFGDMGYVYSICNGDWSPAMAKIAGIIAQQIQPRCFAKKLEWEVLNDEEATLYPECENCGFAACSAVMERFVPVGEMLADKCPAALYEGLPPGEKDRYLGLITETEIETDGQVTGYKVSCPVPKLPAALECGAAEIGIAEHYGTRAGWYYCQVGETNGDVNLCQDGEDNNLDNLMDCDDPSCRTCDQCGGNDPRCLEGCAYRVVFTEAAQREGSLGTMSIQCMQQFTFADENCQEDSPKTCGDGKDNDGNGVFDCDNTLSSGETEAHQPDPNCCPMTVEDGKCNPDMARLFANCRKSAALNGAAADDRYAASQVDACKDQAERIGCSW